MMSIPRTLFEEDHEAFRDTVRRFMEQEVAPHHARWEEQTHVDRDIWKNAGTTTIRPLAWFIMITRLHSVLTATSAWLRKCCAGRWGCALSGDFS